MYGAKLLIKKLHGAAPGDRASAWLYLPVEMPFDRSGPDGWCGEAYNSAECKAFREAAAQAVKDHMPSMPGLAADPADKGHMKGCKWQVAYDQDGPRMNFGPNLQGHPYILVRPLPPSAEVPLSEYERISLEG